jgi:hypothetical protein
MKSTYSQRILSFLSQQEQKNGNAVFNRTVAKRRFRNVKDIHGTIMRTARQLHSQRMLKRVSAGEYALTAKGRRAASN